MERTPLTRRGRRTVPADAGIVIARTIRVHDLAIRTRHEGWLSFGELVVAITNRPSVLGIGGLLGVDFLARFRCIAYRLGPPDELILEQDE